MICRLCLEDKPLRNSHIIPRSFFRRLKKGNGGQLLFVSSDESEPKITNCDPSELLLCESCENYLSVKFEQYGINKLRNFREIEREENSIKITNFNYKRFYLFTMSILWRASVSNLKEFKPIDFGVNINEMIRKCILNDSMTYQLPFKIDRCIRLYMFRIADKEQVIDDSTIKSLIVYPRIELDAVNKEASGIWFLIEGFLFYFKITVDKDLSQLYFHRNEGLLYKREKIRIPIKDWSYFSNIHNVIEMIVRKARK